MLSSLSKHAMTGVQRLKTLANKGVFVLCHVCPFCHEKMGKFDNATTVVIIIIIIIIFFDLPSSVTKRTKPCST